MSRIFDLFDQPEKEQGMFRTPRWNSFPTNGKNGQPDLELLTSEEMMKLVQRVFLLPGPGGQPRTVLFCGVKQSEGCSWTCARVGETLAAQGAGSVCVVDANLRTPSLHEYFGVDNLRGLREAVIQPGAIRNLALTLKPSNLCLIPSGARVSDPHTVLASDRLRSLITELRSEFDHVLVDAPPVALYADAIVLGKLTDGVILVVGANSTRREAARKAKESLEAANVRLLGVVLNRRTFPVPEGLYRRV